MKKYSAIAAAAIGVAGLAANASAATMSLNLSYLGSTTTTSAASLVSVNLSDPANQTTTWHHYFNVAVSFTQDNATDQAFRFLTWDATATGGGTGTLTPSTGNGTTGGVAQKWLGNNPIITDPANSSANVTIFANNADGGPSTGDDLANLLNQTRSDVAYKSNVGEAGSLLTPGNRIARLIYTFSGPINTDVTITVAESSGQSFGWFNANDGNNNNFTTIAGGVTSSSLVIPAVPEPASLGVLALGGLSLLARRRRTA